MGIWRFDIELEGIEAALRVRRAGEGADYGRIFEGIEREGVRAFRRGSQKGTESSAWMAETVRFTYPTWAQSAQPRRGDHYQFTRHCLPIIQFYLRSATLSSSSTLKAPNLTTTAPCKSLSFNIASCRGRDSQVGRVNRARAGACRGLFQHPLTAMRMRYQL